jgi:hypothetical protein
MERSDDEVILCSDGRLEPSAALQDACSESAGRYRWIVRHPGLVVLRRSAGEGLDVVEPRLLMAGEILSKMTILDVINMIASAGWSGELFVYEAGSQRRLTLAQGVLKSAWSNVRSEHLGELLVARQALTHDQLAECVLELAPTTRFGEIVVRKGYIGREQLFEHLKAQMEQIFFGSLLSEEGSYAFLTADTDAEPAPASFHVPLATLLMEGVQRIDEMARFRERVPHGLLCPMLAGADAHPAMAVRRHLHLVGAVLGAAVVVVEDVRQDIAALDLRVDGHRPGPVAEVVERQHGRAAEVVSPLQPEPCRKRFPCPQRCP